MSEKYTKPPNDNEITLGTKIRQCRKMAKLSMQTVADKAGLSVGFISQVERDITVPSLASLRAIADILNQRVSYFIEQPHSDGETTRFHERLSYQVADGGVTYERLSTTFPGSTIQSLIIFQPGGLRSEPISHEGEALVYMLEGELTIEFEDKQVILKSGDSIHFDSLNTHTVWNHTSKLAVSLWCGTMNIFDDDESL